MKKLFAFFVIAFFAISTAFATSLKTPLSADTQMNAANPRAATKKTTAKKSTAKKSTAKKATTKTAAKKTTTKKATTKTAAKKTATKTATKTAAKKTEPKTTIAQVNPTAQRGQETQLGLMPSELDSLNHNLFHADADAIRGARDLESALRYIPFVTFTNTAGFGSQFDMRGQGRLSANGVKMYINGVPSTPLDSYYNPMPINTLIPSLVQEIEVFPGSGAILYGAGTKGGTINIITSKRQRPYFVVGGGYVNTMATEGHSFNAFAHASERFGSSFGVNAGLGFNQMGGPRDGDSQTNAQAVLGATWNFALGQKIDIDADFYYGKTTTTPYNSFLDSAAIINVVNTVTNTNNSLEQQKAISNLPNFNSNKNNRELAGDGDIQSTQIRLNTSIAYENQLTDLLKFDVEAFYHLNSKKYDVYELYLPYFVLGEYGRWTTANTPSSALNYPTYTWYLPPQTGQYLAEFEGKRGDMHYLDQSGTTLTENKFGAKAQLDWDHGFGELIFGLEGMYELSNRNSKNYVRHSLDTGKTNIFARIDSNIDISVITGAVYLLETLNFDPFSLTGGVRYEMKSYNVKFKDEMSGGELTSCANGTCTRQNESTENPLEKDYSKNYGNFVFELTPALRYSNTGVIYARGEFGYVAPPAWATLQRLGWVNVDRNTHNSEPVRLRYNLRETDLKSETYWTAELGWKETIGKRRIPLGFTDIDVTGLLFSLNGFYTDSRNEFYFEGDMWSGMTYNTYDKSRRYGAELAMEQILFNGGLSFNESFTYLKAERFHNEEWSAMPYTYDYKATLGAAIDIGGYLEIVDVGVALWMQNSLYGNQHIYTKRINVLDGGVPGGSGITNYQIADAQDDKLDPYLISDVGVSLNLNKGALVITTGVKNLFDTFYYDYYNNDRSAVVNENRYVVGRGRTVFIEGQYKY